MMIKPLQFLVAFAFIFATAFICGGATVRVSLDLRAGDRISNGNEKLTYSNFWDGEEDSLVTIAENGKPMGSGLTGEGLFDWSVSKNGTYELTHITRINDVVKKV